MTAMFGKRGSEPGRELTEVPADTVLGAGTVFEGQLTVEGSARIEGRVTGVVKVSGLLVVGAKAEIHGFMNELVMQGAAVLMISSDLPEILGMSDRIYVMRQGLIVAEVDREQATQERIVAYAMGHEVER